MCRIIDELAGKRGMKPDDVNYIFTHISGHLVSKIPPLKLVMEDIFSDEADDNKLHELINKMIILLQQHCMEEFKTWQMPHQYIIRQPGNDQIL